MKIKTLIVDDSEGWLEFHIEHIREFFHDKFEIECANSARQGYKLVMERAGSPYDLIISDLQMEPAYGAKFAGEWFVERIKELKEYDNSKIIIISAAYDIKKIAEKLNVSYVSKSSIVRDKNVYKLALDELTESF